MAGHLEPLRESVVPVREQARVHRLHPRPARRGLTTLLILILTVGLTIPLLNLSIRAAEQSRRIALLRAEALTITRFMDAHNHSFYEIWQNPGTGAYQFFFSHTGLRSFGFSGPYIQNNSLFEAATTYIVNPGTTGRYYGALLLDLSAYSIHEEAAIIDTFAQISGAGAAAFEGDKAEFARHASLRVPGGLKETDHVLYFYRFSGLDEDYVYRQDRLRNAPNQMEGPLRFTGITGMQVIKDLIVQPSSRQNPKAGVNVATTIEGSTLDLTAKLQVGALELSGAIQADAVTLNTDTATNTDAPNLTLTGHLAVADGLEAQTSAAVASLHLDETATTSGTHTGALSTLIDGDTQTQSLNLGDTLVVAGQLTTQADILADTLAASTISTPSLTSTATSLNATYANTATLKNLSIGAGGCLGC